MSFSLDPRLSADTRAIGDLALCRALLMNDARYPWMILVPRRDGLVEIDDLAAVERARLMEEMALATAVMRRWPDVEKVNVGALGNVVRQLHVHVVGRRAGDEAWPRPVWGVTAAVAYGDDACEAKLRWLRAQLEIAGSA